MKTLSISSRKSTIRILSHVGFWVLYYTFIVFMERHGKEPTDYNVIFASLALTMPVDILASYTTAYLLLQRYLFKKLYLRFIITVLISGAGFVLILRIIMVYVLKPVLGAPPFEGNFWEFNYLYYAQTIYLVVGVFMAVKLLKYWYKDQQIQQDLEQQNIKSEMALLRMQVNPHFLFNTLNNIDTLIKEDEVKASESIMMLSEMMRYMLYNSNTRFVPLTKEIEYLKSYISLQKIRLKNPDCVKLITTGSFSSASIAPMILISFIENAFKHGSKRENKCEVIIKLDLKNGQLTFSVENSVDVTNQQQKDATRGIGLDNLERRLDLIYEDRYVLDIEHGKDRYLIKLKMTLDED